MNEHVSIQSSDFWVKIVEMLQQNWAVIEPETTQGVRVYFISDTSGVFDEMSFVSEEEASRALEHNGFRRFLNAPDLQLRPPSAPFAELLIQAGRSIAPVGFGDHEEHTPAPQIGCGGLFPERHV